MWILRSTTWIFAPPKNGPAVDVVAGFVVNFVEHLQTHPGFMNSETGLLPKGIGLNINYPSSDTPRGIKVAVQGQTVLVAGVESIVNMRCGQGGSKPCGALNVGESSIGAPIFSAYDAQDVKDSDTDLFNEGYITIVPIAPDYTADSVLKYKSLLTGFKP